MSTFQIVSNAAPVNGTITLGLFKPGAGGDSIQIAAQVPGDVTVPCLADWNNDGEVNFFDVQVFLADFSGNNMAADVNEDGELNFFDVQVWLAAFSAGCP
jgi:hypothetical protein